MILEHRIPLLVARQVGIDQDHVAVDHPGQALQAERDADGDDQEREDGPHVPPEPGIDRQEEVAEQDGDQEGAKDGLEPLEQVKSRGDVISTRARVRRPLTVPGTAEQLLRPRDPSIGVGESHPRTGSG